ncbi:MAG: DHA2 family efflux MFS transporter permease subunit [Gemmatimonadota bacterium]
MLLHYRSARGRLVLIASILGSGMAFLDGTAVNVVLPAIERDLHTGFAGLQWILNGYLLALGALVLPGGSLADRFGRRRVFLIGVVWFAVASGLCGLAPTIGFLIAGRILQGIGAALLVPASLALVQGVYQPADRSEAIGAWSGWSGLTTLIGPLLGGWFADAFSWRLVFLINPVLALLTLFMAWRFSPESQDARARRLDVMGAIAAVIGLGGVVFTLIEGPSLGWHAGAVILAGAGGLFGAIAFLVIELRVTDPMLPLAFFRRIRFAGVTAGSVTIYFALSGSMFLLTLQLQQVLHYSALKAGASLAPVTILLLVLSPIAGRLATRIGPRLPMTAGPIVAALGVAMMSRIVADATYVGSVLPAVLLFGLGLGFTVAPLTATAMSALDDEHAGLASGVSNAVTRVAGLLAVSLLPLAAGLSAVAAGAGGQSFSRGFQRAMLIGAVIMCTGAVIMFATIKGGLEKTKREQ